MKTEIEIISELKELEKELLRRVKNIQTAIKIISCAHDIVDACESSQPVGVKNKAGKPAPTIHSGLRKCAICAKEFTPATKRTRFCSHQCAKKESNMKQRENDKHKKKAQKSTSQSPVLNSPVKSQATMETSIYLPAEYPESPF